MMEFEKYLNQYFAQPDLKCEINYENGKILRIYYAKKDYIEISLDKYTSNENVMRFLKQNKNYYIGLCKLCQWIKRDNRISENIRKILFNIFYIDIHFDISLRDNSICLEYFDKSIICNFNNDYCVDDYFLKELIKAANVRKSYSYLEKSLKKAIKNNDSKQIADRFYAELKSDEEYQNFMDLLASINTEFVELKENLASVGLNLFVKSLLPEINDNLEIDFLDDRVIFYFKNINLFSKKNKISPLYEKNVFLNFYNMCCLLNKMYYDIYNLVIRNNCNIKNFRIFIYENTFYIASFCEFHKITDFETTYQFVEKTCEKVNINLKNIQKKENVFSIINNVNVLYLCMEFFGEITFQNYSCICDVLNIDNLAAINQYNKIPKLLPLLSSLNIISYFSFINNNDYLIEFSSFGTDIIRYDCVEIREKIRQLNYDMLTYSEAINFLSRKELEIYLSPQKIKENTLEIINSLDNSSYCEKLKSLRFLQYLDKKYLPLLKMKISKINSVQNMGDIYYKIEDFLGREKYF